MTAAREDYGIDAPTVVRTLGTIGGVLLAASAATVALLHWHVVARNGLTDVLRINGLANGGICLAMAAWMLASSRWLKARVAARLLDARRWRGNEQVLDVGCGRGLVAIQAARRVSDGTVTGIDLWQARDLSGNTPDALRANAEAAGVAGRVTVDTGDARSLPYPDAAFDVVTSMTALHNIPDAAGRRAAVAEAWRVTKPGGQILIFDIRHGGTYAEELRALGAVDVRISAPILLWGPVGRRVSASKPPQQA
jgi:arsenite methyltransferase